MLDDKYCKYIWSGGRVGKKDLALNSVGEEECRYIETTGHS